MFSNFHKAVRDGKEQERIFKTFSGDILKQNLWLGAGDSYL
jgi:hypothetical protein